MYNYVRMVTKTTTLEEIYKSSLKFLTPLTPEETYKTIINEALKLVGAEEGAVILNVKGRLKVVYGSTPSIAALKVKRRGFTYNALKKREAFAVLRGEIHKDVAKLGIKSVILIPLSYRLKSIGVLSIRSKKEFYFSKNEMEILKLFGSMASLAIRKTQLHDEVSRALETRDLFIAMASHELRTPLTSVNGYIQLLFNKLKDKPRNEGKWVKYLHWESTRLTNLVEELLKTNQVKTGKLIFNFNECRLSEVIDRALSDFKFTHHDRQFIFSSNVKDTEDKVIGDFDKLVQVVINLIDNAVKFSPDDKHIEIILKSQRNFLILIIKDYGIGVPKDEATRIFEGFYKGKNNFREGMGLGLFLTKNIVEKHNGTIKVLSRPNRGTEVIVMLPRRKL